MHRFSPLEAFRDTLTRAGRVRTVIFNLSCKKKCKKYIYRKNTCQKSFWALKEVYLLRIVILQLERSFCIYNQTLFYFLKKGFLVYS